MLRPTNTWDWPTYLLGALAVGYYVLRGDGFSWRAAAGAGILALGLVGLSSLLFLPFTHNYGSAYSSASLWPAPTPAPGNYLLIHGLFLFFIVTHLARRAARLDGVVDRGGQRRLEPHGWLVIMALVLFLAATVLLLLRGYYVAPSPCRC